MKGTTNESDYIQNLSAALKSQSLCQKLKVELQKHSDVDIEAVFFREDEDSIVALSKGNLIDIKTAMSIINLGQRIQKSDFKL